MRRRPYRPERGQKLTLADHLAIDRTILSNERTSLAYGRTALAMLVVGGTCLKFFASWYMWTLGGLFIAGGLVVAARGVVRYRETAKYLAAALEEQTGATQHPLKESVRDQSATPQSAEKQAAAKARDSAPVHAPPTTQPAQAATTKG